LAAEWSLPSADDVQRDKDHEQGDKDCD
jgi:hypothetical protein